MISASVAQLDAPSDWRPGGRGFNPRRGRQHSFVEIDHEIFSAVILSLPLIQEGQLSVSGERMCIIPVNRLEDKACPVNVWLGKLTALDMTPLGWLGRKTPTQTNNYMIHNLEERTLMPYAKRKGQDQHAHPHSLIWAFSVPSTYTSVSIDFVSGQRRPRSACTNAQAELGLRCPQIA